MNKIKKNTGLFLVLYVADQIIISLLGLHPSIYQAILLWVMVKVVQIPFKIKKEQNNRRF